MVQTENLSSDFCQTASLCKKKKGTAAPKSGPFFPRAYNHSLLKIVFHFGVQIQGVMYLHESEYKHFS